jgi:uncharacterized protein YcaQ
VTRLERVPAESARLLLLEAQGLTADPARRATPAAVYRQIERMGFVQVDTINVVERAHHHILFSRFDDYRPRMLEKLLERDRKLFEHWTHDASIIPTAWFPHWRHRFERYRRRLNERGWWKRRLGRDPKPVIRHVLDRISAEGPLMSRDFEHARSGKGDSWWGWKPQKAVLEYLWRVGELAVARRRNFHKVWDLTERVIPSSDQGPAPSQEEHVDWSCRGALVRLGIATPIEMRQFFEAAESDTARSWCERAAAAGEIVAVEVEAADGSKPRRAWAPHDWRRRVARAREAPQRMRLLSPFDPAIRDRMRTRRLFDFDYRVEIFVPAKDRTHGYYVLPLLEGDRLVGRVDPKLHRERALLAVRGPWWEPGVKPTRARLRAFDRAIDRLARQVGASTWERSR